MPAGWVSSQQAQSLLGDAPLGSPTYLALAERLRLLIVDGRLSLGVRMPSERDFAATLGLSRSTVAAAYLQLQQSGYLQPRPGSGSFVAMPTRHLMSAALPQAGAEPYGTVSLAFASGSAPPELASAFRAAGDRLPGLLCGHGYYPQGLEELRVLLADWFSGRGLPTAADQLVITAGALSALNVVAATLLGPGDRVLLESPSYPNAIDVVRRVARPVAYPLPTTGWEPADFELALRQAAPRMSYLIPDFHNPTGSLLPDELRPAIGAALQRHRSVAVVDETLVELNLESATMPTPLAAHLPDAVTIGSASKAFWGGLRIGWIRAPRQLVRPLLETRAQLDLGAAPFEQLVLAELLADRTAVLATQRQRLRAQRDALRAGLEAALPDWELNSPAGGLSLWATLPNESSGTLAALADRHGLLLTAGTRFFVSGGGDRHVRLPYTADAATLRDAVQRLRSLWSEVSVPARAGSGRALGLMA